MPPSGAAAERRTDRAAARLDRSRRRLAGRGRRRGSAEAIQPLGVSAALPARRAGLKSAWVRNPIDAFVLQKLRARGWKPAPPAEPARAAAACVPGPHRPAAHARAEQSRPFDVDELLARPAYGERWARHWLDLVRFAETNGYERDATKPNAWRYRDYVINAFNHDKPFDRFVLEQLAGDELPDASAETFTALGYYRLGPWDDEPADPATDRFDQLDDMVSTTSQVFLGLTLGCARCHNHKFEPLSARDYYSMVALFNGLQRPQKGRAELDLPAGTWAQIDAMLERDRQIERWRSGCRRSACRRESRGSNPANASCRRRDTGISADPAQLTTSRRS